MTLSRSVSLGTNGTSWQTISARDSKENFEPIDSEEVLKKLANLSVTRWNYKAQDPSVKHIGPIAEDFHAAFGLNGTYNGTISTQDFDGVALAAIQGLNKKLERELADKQLEIDRLNEELRGYRSLVRRIEAIERAINN